MPDEDWNSHLARIRADLAALTKAVSGLASETADIKGALPQRIGTVLGQVSGLSHDLVDDGLELGQDALQSVARTADWMASELEEQIERNPLVSVAAAVGFGFVLGFLSRGHRKAPTVQVVKSTRRIPRSPRPKRS